MKVNIEVKEAEDNIIFIFGEVVTLAEIREEAKEAVKEGDNEGRSR